MAKVTVPMVDQEIDTDDGLEDAVSAFGRGTAGVAALMAMVGVAGWVVSRASNAAGVDAPEVPGV